MRRQLFWLTVFTVAMAQLEATVVVYLRALYYPDGFQFPLVLIRDRIAVIEIVRELATLLMLLGVAKLYDRRDPWRQYAAFLFAFGLWDIIYYLGLWVMLDWPASAFDMDILFLVPLPWVGPVLAPVLIALVMILAALGIFQLREDERKIRVLTWEWVGVSLCALGLIAQFCWDAGTVLRGELPGPFAWWLFAVLLAAPSAIALRAWRRSR